jgi:hypothetical protein
MERNWIRTVRIRTRIGTRTGIYTELCVAEASYYSFSAELLDLGKGFENVCEAASASDEPA